MTWELDYYVLQFDLDKFFDPSTMPYLRYFNETQHPLSRLNYIFREQPEVRAEIAECVKRIFDEAAAKSIGYELAVNILLKRILLSCCATTTAACSRSSTASTCSG